MMIDTENNVLRREVINLRAELAAERAARRTLESRLETLRRRAQGDPALPMLKRIKADIEEYIRDGGLQPFEFRAPESFCNADTNGEPYAIQHP